MEVDSPFLLHVLYPETIRLVFVSFTSRNIRSSEEHHGSGALCPFTRRPIVTSGGWGLAFIPEENRPAQSLRSL